MHAICLNVCADLPYLQANGSQRIRKKEARDVVMWEVSQCGFGNVCSYISSSVHYSREHDQHRGKRLRLHEVSCLFAAELPFVY